MSKAQLNHNRKIQIRNNKKHSENVFNQKGRYKKITTSATQRGYKVNIKFRKTKDNFTNVIMDKKDRSKFFPVKDDSVGYGTDYTVKDCADRLCFRCNTMLFYEKYIVCRTNEDDSVSLCSGTGKITITEKDELEEWSSYHATQLNTGDECPDCEGTGQYYEFACLVCDENMDGSEAVPIKYVEYFK